MYVNKRPWRKDISDIIREANVAADRGYKALSKQFEVHHSKANAFTAAKLPMGEHFSKLTQGQTVQYSMKMKEPKIYISNSLGLS